MFKNHFKIAWRNIIKHRFHSILNIAGLAIGIAFTLLMAAYVWNEWKVNSDLKNIQDQYIIQSNWKNPEMGLAETTVGPMVKMLKEQYPRLVANFYRWDGITSNVSKGDKVFREGLQIGDTSLLNMYGFKVLAGDPRSALNEPFSVVITDDRAIKYFGKTDVVGQAITIESFSGSKHDFKITAVLKMPGINSVTRFRQISDNGFFLPSTAAQYFSRSLDAWDNPNIAGYLELQKGVTANQLSGPMQQLLNLHAPSQLAENMQPYLVPLRDFYLWQNTGLIKKMIYTVSLIAIFILLMAIVNFINISIGKSSSRLKEIGVRKVMGGTRKQLVYQFLTESIFITFFATLVALIIYVFANPYLSSALGNQIPKLSVFSTSYWLVTVLFLFLVGLVAGIYPAFILSAIKPIDSVKGKLPSVNQNIFLRKFLVGFQFCIASIVLICALILSKQILLFFGKDLGYDKEYVVSVLLPRNWTDAGVRHMQTIRNEFERMPAVSAASLTWTVPDGSGSGSMLLYGEGEDSSRSVPYESLIADEKYLNVFNIPLAAGRDFRPGGDSLNILINQAAVAGMGLKNAEDAIGKSLFISAGLSLKIIGVSQDFHFGSMKNKIRPLVITHVDFNKAYRLLCFKLKPGNVMSEMEVLQKKWSALLPGTAFEYKFMDDSLKLLYFSEIQLKKASQIATTLALIIAILGIIGLVSLSIQKRTKEIGVRKVLGASLPDIASLFIKDFLPVIICGGIISIPIAWFSMQQWLNDYNYRVEITAWPFIISIAGLGIITSLLIILQISKAALQNPVTSLRTE